LLVTNVTLITPVLGTQHLLPLDQSRICHRGAFGFIPRITVRHQFTAPMAIVGHSHVEYVTKSGIFPGLPDMGGNIPSLVKVVTLLVAFSFEAGGHSRRHARVTK
jgi:hypothetical protein